MNNILNVSPLAFFNVAMLVNGMTGPRQMPDFMSYQWGMGYDRSSTANQQASKKKPRWFNQYFASSLSRSIQLPYRAKSSEFDTGAHGAIGNDTMAAAFARNSMASPADAFNMFKNSPMSFTQHDASSIMNIVKDTMRQAGQKNIQTMLTGETSQGQYADENIIEGQFIGEKTSIYNNVNDPTQYSEMNSRFVNVLGEALPLVDRKQMQWLFNIQDGRGARTGDVDLGSIAALSKIPQLRMMEQLHEGTRSGSARKQLMRNMVSRQIKLGQQNPAPTPFMLSGGKDSARAIAQQYATITATTTALKQRLMARYSDNVM